MWKILALLLALAIVIAITIRLFRSSDASTSSPAPQRMSEEVGAPPSDSSRNPRAAVNYVKRELCLATCTRTANSCRATATEPEQAGACATASTACESACAHLQN